MIGMCTMKEVRGLVEEMMRNFKSEPDLPKEPKTKDGEALEASASTSPAKSKAKPKPKAQGKPRAVAAPAISRRSKTSSCMLLSALVGIMRGQRGEGVEMMSANSHDTVPLPYLPEGGGLYLLLLRPRGTPQLLFRHARLPEHQRDVDWWRLGP